MIEKIYHSIGNYLDFSLGNFGTKSKIVILVLHYHVFFKLNNLIATSKIFCPNVKRKERSIREMVPSFLVVVVCAKILPLGGVHKLLRKDFTTY